MITAERLIMGENIMFGGRYIISRAHWRGIGVKDLLPGFLTSSVATYLAPIARLPRARGRLVLLTDGIAVVSRQLRGTFELLRWRTTVASGLPFLWI
jgi:hypothetical protein